MNNDVSYTKAASEILSFLETCGFTTDKELDFQDLEKKIATIIKHTIEENEENKTKNISRTKKLPNKKLKKTAKKCYKEYVSPFSHKG